MRSLSYVLVLVLGLIQLAWTQNSGSGSNVITVPPGGFNVTAGVPFNLQWTSPSANTVTIQLITDSGAGQIINLGNTLPSNGSAYVTIPANTATYQKYKFKITDDSNSSNSYSSPSFNINPPPAGMTMPSAASSTGSSPSSSSTSTSSAGLPTGAIAGIAIGAVLGIAALVGLIAFFLIRHRKHRRWQEQQQQQLANNPYAAVPHEERAPPYEMMNAPYDQRHQSQPGSPNKPFDQWPDNSSHGAAMPHHHGPSEVPASHSYPRELEGEAPGRFQPQHIAELPANEVQGTGDATRGTWGSR